MRRYAPYVLYYIFIFIVLIIFNDSYEGIRTVISTFLKTSIIFFVFLLSRYFTKQSKKD